MEGECQRRRRTLWHSPVDANLAAISFNLVATSLLSSGFSSLTFSSSFGQSSQTSPSMVLLVGNGSSGESTPHLAMTTGTVGLSLGPLGRFSMVRTRDFPEMPVRRKQL